ncbi:choice-of-anchor L domain-containing protein [Fluviicola taffensis]|uniref:PKD domain containing protein n=1 Tax=Fluviicola taffensis (strain DSM 16823 / NCIMB 13979 / RW262) TaxID=755732 RepID=F2IKA4_FLUTR|nr:choice-of-anchor L domain-containing protein [Fluviicola taffensis]AEA44007.1 PKD domain containing protein [Fluviicola taffensis DSM 16823]
MKLFWIILILLPFSAISQLVTTPQSAASLVQNTLLGPGVTVSNIVFNGGTTAIGRFTAAGTNLGINSGVILTTGTILNNGDGPQGPNNSANSGMDNNKPGFSALNGQAGAQTFNASILEFDFVPYSDTVRFKYVFGSEEYPEFVGTEFNDAFAFFISGPGIPGGTQNMAKLPNGSTVTINNVNNGNPGTGGVGGGPSPAVNPAYFVPNGNGSQAPYNSSSNYIQYDGFTKVLEAVSKVQCGQTYHLIIAIADAKDPIYDSGIFLEANSLTSKAPVEIKYTMSSDPFNDGKTMAEGCVTTTVTLNRTKNISQALTIPIIVSGTATEGVDYTNIPNSVTFSPGQSSISFNFDAFADGITEGIETIMLDFQTLDACGNLTPFILNLQIGDIQPVTVTVNSVDKLCPQDDAVLTAVPGGGSGPYTILWSTGETTESITVNPPATQNYTVSVTDACLHQTVNAIAIVTVPIYQPIVLVSTPDITEICPYVPKELTVQVTGGAGNYVYSWHLANGTVLGTNDTVDVIPSTSTMYYIKVTDQCDVSALDSVMYVITSPPLVLTMSPDQLICPGDTVSISVSATGGYGQYFYNWLHSGETTPQVSVHPYTTTTYTVSVSDECQTFTVEGSTKVNVIEPIADFIISSHTLFEDLPITFQNLTSGGNTYEWEFGDGQSSTLVHPNNTYDVPGTYYVTLIATNIIGCKDTVVKPITIQEEYWIYVPNTFTPDGNQFNNTFKASMINIKATEVFIYDRWGLLVFHSTSTRWEWDGTYKDLMVPDGTYTYKIKYTSKSNIEDTLIGHVNVLK